MDEQYLQTHQKVFEAPKENPEFDVTRSEWARLHILNLTRHNFFGKLTLHFENGKIIRAMKEENLKP